MTPSLDSDLLRTFLAVAEAGSVTGGARRINRSQSATSLQIKQLESVVGRPLLRRHGRGVVLTSVGERLLPAARQVTSALDATLAGLRDDGLAGRLRIGLPDDYGRSALPRIVADFARRHPGVELEVTCALGDGFRNALRAGVLDVAVHELPEAPRGVELLRTEQLIWMTSRFHDPAAQDPLPVALFDRACWWRDAALDDLAASGRRHHALFSSESTVGVRAAITSGIAVGLLSEPLQGDDLAPVPDLAPPRRSHLVLEVAPGVAGPACAAVCAAMRDAFRQP